MTADVRNVLAVPASRLRAFTSSPALTAAYLGNVRRAPRFAGSPRLRRRRPAACPPVVLRLHRPRPHGRVRPLAELAHLAGRKQR